MRCTTRDPQGLLLGIRWVRRFWTVPEELDAQAKFDMYFGSRLKKVFMPDESGRRNPLKSRLVEEEGCGSIADLLEEEQEKLTELLNKKLLPKAEGQLKATHLAKDHIDVQGHPPIK